MIFIGRIVAGIVIGWILGVVLAIIMAGGTNFEQIPVFTVPFGIVLTYFGSFFIVRPGWMRW